MKTIDEVIEILERQIDKTRIKILDKDLLDSVPDALHYLQEYQGNLIGKEISETFDEAFTEMYNPPLTWEELKQMIDSIVWLEWSSDGKWAEVIHATDDEIEYYRFGTDELCYIVRKDYAPDKWQAYRKERE